MIGGNNGIVEIYALKLNIAIRKPKPLYEQICIVPKWLPNPSPTQLFEEVASRRCLT